MKILVDDPRVAAAITGGCTFEVNTGWWTSTDQRHPELGDQFDGVRDAIYIPTLQKTGKPVDAKLVRRFKKVAHDLGFTDIVGAAGMWILSDTGEAQVEYIWICSAGRRVSETVRAKMPALAEKIKKATNQDCVTWEVAGVLHFTD